MSAQAGVSISCGNRVELAAGSCASTRGGLLLVALHDPIHVMKPSTLRRPMPITPTCSMATTNPATYIEQASRVVK